MNRLSLTLGLTAMDLCWVYPWALLMGLFIDASRARPLLSPPSVLALVLAGALTTQALGRAASRRRALRLTLAGLGAVAALLAVRIDQYPDAGALDWLRPFAGALAVVLGQFSAEAFTFALALYLWWRGVRLGSQQSSYVDVESAFRWGIGRLVAFGLVIALTLRPSGLASLEARTTPFVVGFFFVSLLTLALGRLESLRTRTRRLGINSQWFGVLVLVAGLVVLAALLLGQLVSFELLLVFSRPLFDLLGQVLVLVLYLVVIPLSYVIEWLVYLVLSLLQPGVHQPPPQPPQPSDVDDVLQRLFAQYLPPELLAILKAAGAAALLLVALLLVARAMSRWRASSADADATNEERDSLFDAERVWRQLLAWLRRLLGRAPRPTDGRAAAANPVLNQPEDSISSVRGVYRHVLRLGEAAGARRALATTPFEHLASLEQTLEPTDSLVQITDAYVRARYAEAELPEPDTVALRDDLRRITPKGAGS